MTALPTLRLVERQLDALVNRLAPQPHLLHVYSKAVQARDAVARVRERIEEDKP